MSLFSTYSGTKASSVIEAQHSEEMADVNFLKFPFLQIPHLDTTNQDMLVRGWLLLLFTLVQGEHRKYPSAWLPWTQEEEKQDFIGGLTGVQDVKNSWWLAGWLASGHHTCT